MLHAPSETNKLQMFSLQEVYRSLGAKGEQRALLCGIKDMNMLCVESRQGAWGMEGHFAEKDNTTMDRNCWQPNSSTDDFTHRTHLYTFVYIQVKHIWNRNQDPHRINLSPQNIQTDVPIPCLFIVLLLFFFTFMKSSCSAAFVNLTILSRRCQALSTPQCKTHDLSQSHQSSPHKETSCGPQETTREREREAEINIDRKRATERETCTCSCQSHWFKSTFGYNPCCTREYQWSTLNLNRKQSFHFTCDFIISFCYRM